jgi:hypothetical protein
MTLCRDHVPRSGTRDIILQIVPDLASAVALQDTANESLIHATPAPQREPIVKIPSAPICTIAIRS